MRWNSTTKPVARRTKRLNVEKLEDREVPATLLGLTTADRLVIFDSANPSVLKSNVRIVGMPVGENIVSLDARPANGLVYGLSNANKLYTLNAYTGRAQSIPAGLALPLTTKSVGMTFNPVIDEVRLVGANEQNFQLPVDLQFLRSGPPIAYDSNDAKAGLNPSVVAIGYDFNYQVASVSTLFGIDTVQNTLVRMGDVAGSPTLNTGKLHTIGNLGINAVDARAGFDIAADGTAYAALGVGVSTNLYTVDLDTGAATSIDRIGASGLRLDAITALPRAENIYAVTLAQRLIHFRADNPSSLLGSTPVRGLLPNESIAGMDFRPANGELWAHTTANRILIIDPTTGQTRQVGAPINTAPPFSAGKNSGFDFDPTTDRIRVVGPLDANMRFDPLTGTPVDSDGNAANGYTPDTWLAYAAGDVAFGVNPEVVATAFDRADADLTTAFTTLFGIDAGRGTLVRIGAVDGVAGGSPNLGQLFTLGSLGVATTERVGFDIAGDGTKGVGAAFAVMAPNGQNRSKLYTINLASGLLNQPLGQATEVGTVGGGQVVAAMAVAPATIEFEKASYVGSERTGVATLTITRTGGVDSVVSVKINTADMSALEGINYQSLVELVVTFNRGETRKTIQIQILNDRVVQPKKQFLVDMSGITADGGVASIGRQSSTIVVV